MPYSSTQSYLTPPIVIYTLSLHDALPIYDDEELGGTGNGHVHSLGRITHHGRQAPRLLRYPAHGPKDPGQLQRSEEHTSELQSLRHLVCRLLLEKKNKNNSNSRNV